MSRARNMAEGQRGSRGKPARYLVAPRESGSHDALSIQADSAIEAAIGFAEAVGCEGAQLSVVITDCETGRRRCLLIDFHDLDFHDRTLRPR